MRVLQGGTILAALLMMAPAIGQAPDVDADPNFGANEVDPVGGVFDNLGDLTFGPIDLQLQVADIGILGVAFADNTYYVSGRAVPGGGPGTHQLYVFDAAGNFTIQLDQHPNAFLSNSGYRDGTTDGTLLYFGEGGGLYTHEIANLANVRVQSAPERLP